MINMEPFALSLSMCGYLGAPYGDFFLPVSGAR